MVFENQILIPRSKFKSNFYCRHCGEYRKQEECNLKNNAYFCPECGFKVRTKVRNPSFQNFEKGDRSKRRCEFCLNEFNPTKSNQTCCKKLCAQRKRRGTPRTILSRNCRECGKPILNPRNTKYDKNICAKIGALRSTLLKLQRKLRNEN